MTKATDALAAMPGRTAAAAAGGPKNDIYHLRAPIIVAAFCLFAPGAKASLFDGFTFHSVSGSTTYEGSGISFSESDPNRNNIGFGVDRNGQQAVSNTGTDTGSFYETEFGRNLRFGTNIEGLAIVGSRTQNEDFTIQMDSTRRFALASAFPEQIVNLRLMNARDTFFSGSESLVRRDSGNVSWTVRNLTRGTTIASTSCSWFSLSSCSGSANDIGDAGDIIEIDYTGSVDGAFLAGPEDFGLRTGIRTQTGFEFVEIVTNVAPVADAGTPDPLVLNAGNGASFGLNGSASDADGAGDIESIAWTSDAVSGTLASTAAPSGLDIADIGLTTTQDSETLTLTVADGDTSDSDTLNVSYQNSPATIDSFASETKGDGSVELSATLSDLDLALNDTVGGFETLSWSLTAVDSGQSLLSGSFSGSDTSFDIGGTLDPALLAQAFDGTGLHDVILAIEDLAIANPANNLAAVTQTLQITVPSVPAPAGALLLLPGVIWLATRR